MIRRIVFDLDNTLLPWKREFDAFLRATLEQFEICYDENLVRNIDNAVVSYEEEHVLYNQEKLAQHISRKTGIVIDASFIEAWEKNKLEAVQEEIEEGLHDTLEYLDKKYELVVLTNWFGKLQADRLKKAGLLQYFRRVFGGDENYRKPQKGSYLQAVKPYKLEECLMIGDNVTQDVEAPLSFGMQAILYNPNKNGTKYPNIQRFLELKEML